MIYFDSFIQDTYKFLQKFHITSHKPLHHFNINYISFIYKFLYITFIFLVPKIGYGDKLWKLSVDSPWTTHFLYFYVVSPLSMCSLQHDRFIIIGLDINWVREKNIGGVKIIKEKWTFGFKSITFEKFTYIQVGIN